MAYKDKTVNLIYFSFNYNNFIELCDSTTFNISDYLWDGYHNSDATIFTIDNVNYELRLPLLCSQNDCDKDVPIFINIKDDLTADKIDITEQFKRRIYDQVSKLVDDINAVISKFSIPVDHLDTTIWNDADESFYCKVGSDIPEFVQLKCECQPYDEISW